MSFSDLTFLFYFLPLFFAVYYILPFRFKMLRSCWAALPSTSSARARATHCCCPACCFCTMPSPRAMAGKEVRTRKALLIIALAADLFCLVYFKYAAFILENLGKLTGTVFSLVELALPLGVSFYLFQSAGTSSTSIAARRRRKTSSTTPLSPSRSPSSRWGRSYATANGAAH